MENTVIDQKGNIRPNNTIRLHAGGEPATALLAVEFQTAPDKPSAGEPGKQPGDLLLRQGPEGHLTLLVSLGLMYHINRPGNAI